MKITKQQLRRIIRETVGGLQDRHVEVHWDLGDTEFEDMPYDQALRAAGLPAVIELPAGMDEEELSDWLSDEYGFTHHGWQPIEESKVRITKGQLEKIIKEELGELREDKTNMLEKLHETLIKLTNSFEADAILTIGEVAEQMEISDGELAMLMTSKEYSEDDLNVYANLVGIANLQISVLKDGPQNV